MESQTVYSKLLSNDIFIEINEKLAKPQKTIKEHTDDLLDVLEKLWELGYIEDEKIYKLTEKACIYHDIGKINEEFQKRIKSKNSHFDDKKEVSHNILSLYFVDENNFENINDYLIVANAVLNHHNYCDNIEVLREKAELIKKLLKNFNHKEVKKQTYANLARLAEDKDAIKLKGYLYKCDYNASAIDEKGNRLYEVEYKNDFLEKSLQQLLDKWKEKDNTSSWNKLQEFCIKNRAENIIAIAQTGMGKTEGGLLWIGDNKGFFILPIRTAINAIYKRVEKEILNMNNDSNDIEEINTKLGLLHSSSLEYLLSEYKGNENNKEDNEISNNDQGIIKYEQVAKQLSLPLNITTLDQLFDFVFKYQSYELKLTTLSYSKLVIDEIQMYSPDLLAYLIYGIERIAEQGGKIAILTATLAPFVKDLLSKNINFKAETFTNDLVRHNLKILDKRINADDIFNKYMDNKRLNKSNKILVVCNSIKESQELYSIIKKKLEEVNEQESLNILHAKFIKSQRLSKEQEILKFGKTYKENTKELDKQNGIWISTSIVEASLDIDFDYLFTELQDINSLFQRLGRCNRKGKKNNDENNCYIYTKIEESYFIDGDRGYIDKTIFDLSKQAISNCEGQITESQKIELIDKYMTLDKIKYSEYFKLYKKTYKFIKNLPPNEFNKQEVRLRNILTKEIIPSPIYINNLEEIQNIERELSNPEIKSKENKARKIHLQNELRKFTVSVYPGDIYTYQRALKNKKAISYRSIKLSDREFIPVIDCDYDEKGYSKKDFNNTNDIEDCIL